MDETTTSNFGFSMDEVVTFAKAHAMDFAIALVTAIVIFYVGRIVVKLVTRALRKVMNARDVDPTLVSFISNLANMVLMVIVVIAAISALGIQTTSFVAILGAAGLAVGLALQGSLSNFASGVLIIIFRPYKVGDFVEAADISGSVEEVQILTTVLKTPDNKKVIVPNSQIMSGVITNYSANDTRRVDLVAGVSYSDDLDKVRTVLEEIVAGDDRVLDDPPVTIAVSELADSSVNFIVRPWVKTADYWAVHFNLTETIKKRFDEEGISIPFPQQDIYIHKVD